MFNCYTHGWTSEAYPCRECFPLKVTTSTSTTFIYPEALVGISSSELARLKDENKRLREALEFISSGKTFCSYSVSKMDKKCANVARAALEQR